VCNAVETLLVHRDVAAEFLPGALRELADAGVAIAGCERTRGIFPTARVATEADWETEYLDLELAVRVVEDLEAAIEHIERYGSKHSEAILTADMSAARTFQRDVDAAAVYVNASTRFTDGFEFGFGAEIGISTQKLHARGPMGLAEIVTHKYLISGDGQIRF
jgi:glutamate-5-semialdehyde dehydrogenase